MKNYYEQLNVKITATADEIKKSYKKLAKQYHPDQNKGDKKAAEKFAEINNAYTVLSDEEERKKYDDKLGRGSYSKDSFKRDNTKKGANANRNFNMNSARGFEEYFGFNPKTKDVNMGRQKNNSDAMRTEDAFKHIFGDDFRRNK